jgi:hypothetical protein
LEILAHNGDSLVVEGAKVSVFEESNKVSFSSLLKSEDGR